MRRLLKVVHCEKGSKDTDEIEHLQFSLSDRSIRDASKSILTNIILELTLKEIVISKCVRKTWYRLISDPQFSELHSAQRRACPLIRTFNPTHVSRSLYFLEATEVDSLRRCAYYFCNSRCQHQSYVKPETKFKFPLRNPDLVLKHEEVVRPGVGIKRKRCIRVKPKEHKFNVVNSCNGFICLSEPLKNDPVVVCNPVTGEFINLPVPDSEKLGKNIKDVVDCGFGFSPKTRQYKVSRMSNQGNNQRTSCPVTGSESYYNTKAEIHTLGTQSWKRIGYAPCSTDRKAFPTYLNGAIHWLCWLSGDRAYCVVVFNLSDEQFLSFRRPCDLERGFLLTSQVSLGVLKGCLCVCDASGYNPINIWVMKEYGVEKSWVNMISINVSGNDRWPVGLYQPIDFLKDRTLLMFQYPSCGLIYYHPTRDPKYVQIQGIKSKFEVIAYIPSFFSLKDAVMGDDNLVLNIKSR